jgi:hypothetical protein
MRSLWFATMALGFMALGLMAMAPMAGSQTPQPPAPLDHAMPGTGAMPLMPMNHAGGMAHMQAMIGRPGVNAGVPTQPGQAAFGTIQEIVGMLQADPSTDWSNVNIDALRQHLIDMDEVTMHAAAVKEPIENGLRIAITGSGTVLDAIRRMVPDHAHEIDGMNGWTVRAAPLSTGVALTATTANPAEVAKIRGLGFMGMLVQGGHHQAHHLAMAKGETVHLHQ